LINALVAMPFDRASETKTTVLRRFGTVPDQLPI
jgi:hypothetical protein